MATIYGPDGFAYSNGDLASVASANWETCSGFGGLTVDTSKLKGNGASDGAVRLTASAWGSGSTTAQWAQVAVTTLDSFVGPAVFSNGVSSFYYLDVRSGTTDLVLYRVSGGSFTQLTLWTLASNPVANDIFYLEAVVSGAQVDFIAKRNGASVGTYSDTDAGRLTSGRPGIRIWQTSTTGRLDDFTAGDFSVGGSTTRGIAFGTRGTAFNGGR